MTENAYTKCFAYSRDGQRCQQIAGHDGLHAVVKEWSDDESWTPDMDGPAVEHLVEISDEELQDMGPVPVYGSEGRPGTCLLCSHRMHVMECPNGACDCRAGIAG